MFELAVPPEGPVSVRLQIPELMPNKLGPVGLGYRQQSFDTVRLVSVIVIQISDEFPPRQRLRRVGGICCGHTPTIGSRPRIGTTSWQIMKFYATVFQFGDALRRFVAAVITDYQYLQILVTLVNYRPQATFYKEFWSLGRCDYDRDQRGRFVESGLELHCLAGRTKVGIQFPNSLHFSQNIIKALALTRYVPDNIQSVCDLGAQGLTLASRD